MIKIDYSILINLKRRPDRLAESLEELSNNSIRAFVWTAIDKENGEEGLRLTMLKFFDTMISQHKINNVLVLEDDIKFLNAGLLQDCLNQLPHDYDLFHLGPNLLAPAEQVSKNLLKLSAAYSTHGVVYSRQGMKEILKHLPGEKGFDQIINNKIISRGKSYCSYPMIATQRDSKSDIAKWDDYANNGQAQMFLDHENKAIRWGKMIEERFFKFAKLKPIEELQQSERPCPKIHMIDGRVPESTDVHLDGRTCDCGKILHYAELCQTCGGMRKFLKSKENPEYIPQNV